MLATAAYGAPKIPVSDGSTSSSIIEREIRIFGDISMASIRVLSSIAAGSDFYLDSYL